VGGIGKDSVKNLSLIESTKKTVMNRNQKIYLMDMETEAVLPLGRFVQPEEFTGHWRCDIHCSWSPNGDMIGFNSTHTGSRQVYIIKFDNE
jgi:Tol biopolymer transport system component